MNTCIHTSVSVSKPLYNSQTSFIPKVFLCSANKWESPCLSDSQQKLSRRQVQGFHCSVLPSFDAPLTSPTLSHLDLFNHTTALGPQLLTKDKAEATAVTLGERRNWSVASRSFSVFFPQGDAAFTWGSYLRQHGEKGRWELRISWRQCSCSTGPSGSKLCGPGPSLHNEVK